jgi:hypothetical protein
MGYNARNDEIRDNITRKTRFAKGGDGVFWGGEMLFGRRIGS